MLFYLTVVDGTRYCRRQRRENIQFIIPSSIARVKKEAQARKFLTLVLRCELVGMNVPLLGWKKRDRSRQLEKENTNRKN